METKVMRGEAARERSARLGYAPFRTPWGEGAVMVVDGCPRHIFLPWHLEAPGMPARAASNAAEGVTAAGWALELEAYFDGRRDGWAPWELDMDALGFSGFQKAVYTALLQVPAGDTVSYGRLAEMAGHPRAARAVGTAMARNPLPVIIPCHRVVRENGDLGNYGAGGPRWKEKLLGLERGKR